MKRVSAFLLALLILTSLCVPAALADGDSFYYISGLEAFVTVPDDLIVFTREEFPDSDMLSKYGLTEDDASDILDMMVESNVFLRALDISGASEHIIVCSRISENSGVSDFDDFSDEELVDIVNNILLVDGIKNGVSYSNYDLYRNDEASYIALTFTSEDEGTPVYGLEYYTVKNGSAISLIFRSYGKPYEKESAVRHREMVDSLSFFDDTTEDGIAYGSEGSDFDISFLFPALIVLVLVISVASSKKKKKAAAHPAEKAAPEAGAQIRTAKDIGVAPALKTRVMTGEGGRRVIVPREGSIIESLINSESIDSDFYSQSYRKPTTYCGQCGAKVYDNGRICPICGAKVKKKKRDYDL